MWVKSGGNRNLNLRNNWNFFCSALTAQRSKRRKVEKKSASAFEKLRELKQGGSRNKWATEESSAIYDEVDEDEYTKIVSKRALNDWIVDDGGLWKFGNLSDGKEIDL